MLDKHRRAVAKQWKRHLKRPLPPQLRGEEIADVDMVMLDADVAGCVATWLSSSSDLDDRRARILQQCLVDLDKVAEHLTDPDVVEYYAAARTLAASVIAAQRTRP